MKTVILFFSAFLCLQVFAQETSTTALSQPTISAGQSADGVTATPMANQKVSSWNLTLGSENFTYEADHRGTSSGPIISYNFVGARYNPSRLWELELRQQLQMTSSRERLCAVFSQMGRNLHI